MPELCQSKFNLTETHWLIRFITWIERISIQFADRAICVHKPHLDVLVAHGNPSNKFLILINLPDPKIFSNSSKVVVSDHPSFMLIYHGLVARRHGLETAIRAVYNLKDEIKQVKLMVIGEGDDIPRLIDLVSELKLGDRVDIHNGYIPIEELVPIIQVADIGIVPILYDNFTRYMLPVKLLEYVALKIPVICSRTETISAYFDESMVRFFSPGNINELTEQIRFLYRNPEKRREISVNADQFNHLYNWSQQKQLYYQFIDKLITKV